ncbi:MAG: carboxypeptidase-like regulatory domain-containing protein, partial [Mucilaginibacter sp.]
MKFFEVKNPEDQPGWYPLKKFLLVMKLTTCLLIIAFVQASATGYGQVTLHEKNAPFEKVMSSIRKQTGYTIFYNENVKTGPITIDIDNASIPEALDKCFLNLPVTYRIVSNSIFLKEKAYNPPAIISPPTISPPTSISGIVLNEDKKPVEGASVVIKGTEYGTVTDTKGYFRLEGITDSAVLRITSVGYQLVEIGIRRIKNGYKAYTLRKELAENLKSGTGAEINFTLRLVTAVKALSEFSVKANVTRQVGTVVELKHRGHLNLGQVLEGSVPGLTLQSTTTSSQDLSVKLGNLNIPGIDNVTFTGVSELRDLYNRLKGTSPFIGSFSTFDAFYNAFYSTAASTNDPSSSLQFVNNTTNNGLIPELRGSSSFTGNTAGMLVVVDGVAQDNFPANYPMSNVAKLEVIKDPAELIKWGPKAIGGLILITTNGATAGKLQVNYTTNLYFSPRPNISNAKLQLASTAQILAEYKEQVDKGLASYIGLNTTGLKPAQLLLYNYNPQVGGAGYDSPQFKSSWDSLAGLSNREQLRMLYQNSFIQTHSLNISGGTQAYRFTLGGVYNNSPGSTLGSDNTNLNLNLQNIFSLLKNKLRITWQFNTINSSSQTSTGDDGSDLDPYQMLLNPQGHYVYNYQGLVTLDQNNAMQQLGYLDYGANPLEDARNTKNISKTATINSRLNIDWNFIKGLQWSTAIVYDRSTGNIHNLDGGATSQARQLVDNYGSPNSSGGVDFYVPRGGILTTRTTSAMDWNLRSGLIYYHRFDTLNMLNATLGLAAANTQSTAIPHTAIYGYSPDNRKGLPILSSPASGIYNYQGTAEYPSQLLAPGLFTAMYDRSLAFNGSMTYIYNNRYTLNLQYNSVYTPDVGFFPSYSGTKNYAATASWEINKEDFFKLPFINTFILSATASKIQLAKLPGQVSTNAVFQSLWNNTALMATGYTPSQLTGQQNNNIGGAAQIGLGHDRIHIHGSYNYSSDGTHQVNGQVAYDIYREPWFNIPVISSLVIDASLQDFNALQAQAIVMGTNAPSAGGGFSLASNNSFGTLPPATINKE